MSTTIMQRLRDWFRARTAVPAPCIDKQSPAVDLEQREENIDRKIEAYRSFARALRREHDDAPR